MRGWWRETAMTLHHGPLAAPRGLCPLWVSARTERHGARLIRAKVCNGFVTVQAQHRCCITQQGWPELPQGLAELARLYALHG